MLFDFFSDFFDDDMNLFMGTNPHVVNDRACPVCKTYLSEIVKTGKAGCSNCYNEFRDEFEYILNNIHSSSTHSGKAPKNADKKIRLKKEKEELSKKMQKAVMEQNFEEAAVLRDKLKTLEQKGE